MCGGHQPHRVPTAQQQAEEIRFEIATVPDRYVEPPALGQQLSRNAEGERVAKWFAKVRSLGIPADGDTFEIGDMLFTICPWWDGPSTRAAVAELLARDAEKRKGKWAWVYHAPPAGSPTSWDGARFFGDEDLSGWIETYKPDFVFCGHVHGSPYSKGGSWVDRVGSTWVFNAGHELGPTPPHVIISTDDAEVSWQSPSFGGSRARLDQPPAQPVATLKVPLA